MQDATVRLEPDRPLKGLAFATCLFADLSESTRIARSLDPEDLAATLEQWRDCARPIIVRHGGVIAHVKGDGLLAVFGHVEPFEQSARRGTEAALELHAAISAFRFDRLPAGYALRMHSGLDSGLVHFSEGNLELGSVHVVGPSVHTAAWLCSRARTGEILVNATALGPQAYLFDFTEAGELHDAKQTDAIRTLQINGRNTLDRRIDAAARQGTIRFVGREAELAALAEAGAKASRYRPQAVVVSGEPGIGKTRLITEFQRGLDPNAYKVLQGYCENYLGAEPLQPFMQIVREALGWLPGVSIERNESNGMAALENLGYDGTIGEIRAVCHALLAARTDQSRLSSTARSAAIVRLVTALSTRSTIVLVLDDWQWADDSSRKVLETLRGEPLALLLLLSSRVGIDDDPALTGALQLDIAPLDPGETGDAIAAWLPNANPFVVDAIHRRSGGSPLFIEELCHAGAADDTAGGEQRVGTDWLNELVTSRLLRLPLPQAEMLRVASVAGNVFSTWLLERLVEGDASLPLSSLLAGQDFVVAAEQPGMLRFKHVLTRDAVYSTVGRARRRALHARVAESIEAGAEGDRNSEWFEALSYHFDAAGDHAKATQFAEAAGDKAFGSMALDRARAHYVTALRTLDAHPDLSREMKLRWCAIAQKLGQTCVFDILDVTEGLLLFERAALLAREVGDVNAIARAEYWLGYVNYAKGLPGRAIRHCEASLHSALASDDQRLVAQVQATLGQALASAGHYDRALPLLRQSVAIKREHRRSGSTAAIGSAYTLARTAYTFGDIGRFAEAHRLFEEALQLLGETEHAVLASIQELICAVHLWQGRWSDASEAGRKGAEIALGCRSRFNTAMGRALGACGDWAGTGSLSALQTLRESTDWIESRGGAVSTSLNYGWLVEASVALGDTARVHGYAARLFMRARAQDRHGKAMGCRALARLAVDEGDADRAERYLAAADRAATQRGSAREHAANHLARAHIDAAAGRLPTARRWIDEASSAFEAMDMQWHLAGALALRDGLPG